MIYLVTGLMRSGTSAMMQALEAGGLPVVKSDARRRVNERSGTEEYRPNPVDLYEPLSSDVGQIGFPRRYDGSALKVVATLVAQLAVHDYSAVLLTRDPREIQASYRRAFGRQLALDWLTDTLAELRHTLANRRDITIITVCSYERLVTSPSDIFQCLRECGWPIDVERAAAVIDPAQHRIHA